jgi:hypothetical protein
MSFKLCLKKHFCLNFWSGIDPSFGQIGVLVPIVCDFTDNSTIKQTYPDFNQTTTIANQIHHYDRKVEHCEEYV